MPSLTFPGSARAQSGFWAAYAKAEEEHHLISWSSYFQLVAYISGMAESIQAKRREAKRVKVEVKVEKSSFVVSSLVLRRVEQR
jgi:hypothetical protein